MSYSGASFAPEEFVPCPPMFVETADGFALTDAARRYLDHPDPLDLDPLDLDPLDLDPCDGSAPPDPDPSAGPPAEPPPAAPSTSPTSPPLTVAERLAAVRVELGVLAGEVPAAARVMAAHELTDTVQVLQEAANVLGSCEQAVVAELDRQGVHEPSGATSTADLLRLLLHLRPAEANRRVARARGCAARVTPTGQVLPPLRQRVAAAQASGSISTDHATVIDRALTRLPVGLPVDTVDEVEATLVELATRADPTDVAALGRHTVDLFDPDGPEPRDQQQRRRRRLRISPRDNGGGTVRGELTDGLLLLLRTVLTPLAAPQPADANGEDTRTPDQRMHDALEDLCDRLLRSGTLPDSGGVPATIAVTLSLQQLQERTGRVTTAHGGDLSIPQLLHLACEAEIIPVVCDDTGGILAYGRSKRLATAAQTKALQARDRGCSFPGCRRPPAWCQRHHIRPWLDHGTTDLDNLTLLCTYHHHGFQTWGWHVDMIDGIPWWTPPAHLDPHQKPVRNTAHHLTDLTDLAGL